MKKKWNLFSISEARSIIMGFAALIVAFFHCYKYNFHTIITNDFFANFLNFLRKTGNVGVDIFLFLSGIGLYFSFSKDSNIKTFYKKRVIRILPSVLIIASIYYLIKGVNLISFIKGITLTNFYIDGIRDFWYFSLIIVLYIIYPFLHKIIDKYGLKGLIVILLISIISTISLMFVLPNLYNKIEIALTRIPVFILGIYYGKRILNKEEINKNYIWLFAILFIICNFVLFNFKFTYYFCVRYIYAILGISIVFLISFIHSKVKFNISDKILTFFGTYSMEIYLIFEKLCVEIITRKLIKINNYFLFYSAMFIITILLSILLSFICKKIVKIFNKSSKKKIS